MDLNQSACKYCGSHGLDMRGNCASCGAPTEYRALNMRASTFWGADLSMSCTSAMSSPGLDTAFMQEYQKRSAVKYETIPPVIFPNSVTYYKGEPITQGDIDNHPEWWDKIRAALNSYALGV